ncbi:MAG: PAS domain S-box protein [Verrucomicrobiae bacterium]|nr:PAS domain S-box protein [Verrucomicrobiae bacterium]
MGTAINDRADELAMTRPVGADGVTPPWPDLFEDLPLLAVELDREGRIRTVNQRLAELAGWRAAEVTGRDWVTAMVPPPESGREREVLERFRAGKAVPRRRESAVRTRSGETRLVRWSYVVVRTGGGEVHGLVALGEELADGSLPAPGGEESELEAMFFGSSGIQVVFGEDGRVRRMNAAAMEYFGVEEGPCRDWRASELMGCWGELEGPPDCGLGEACQGCGLRAVMEDTMRHGTVHRRREVRQKLLRGGLPVEVTMLVSSCPVRSQGRSMVLVGIEDVTAARLAEERVREQAALLAAAQDAICVTDLEGRIRYWNRGAERLFGWSAEEAVGQMAAGVVLGGASRYWAAIRKAVTQEGHWDGELQSFRPGGEPLTVEARASAMRDADGQSRSILLVGTDVTEKRQLERQVFRGQRLESLGTLACGIAHDLNNVLTPVQMVADLLRTAVAGTEGERFLDLLTRSARRGADIIRQLLQFGRGADGAQVPLDLRHLLKETATILRETFPKSIEVQVKVPALLWPVVGDATQLHQVILNLCVNARDAMPRGGTLGLSIGNVELDAARLGTVQEAIPGRYVVLEVADSGSGIAPDVANRIFDPFFTTKPQGQGSGLGLSTVQGIVRGHKGFVLYETEVGRGSAFRVHLPASPETSGVDVGGGLPPAAQEGGRQWVLVADDEDAIRELARVTLERSGYQVITARDGAEAISIFGRRHAEIGVVVVNMMMPYLDGASAIAAFRRLNGAVPVVAVSGMPSQREDAERAWGGPVAFLQKPFPIRALIDEVTRCVEAGGRADPAEP